MNKKAIYLIIVLVLLASLQLACSFSDLLGNLEQDTDQFGSQESNSQGNNHKKQNAVQIISGSRTVIIISHD